MLILRQNEIFAVIVLCFSYVKADSSFLIPLIAEFV